MRQGASSISAFSNRFVTTYGARLLADNLGRVSHRCAAEGGAAGGDKQWFRIDKTNGMGHGLQYQAWSTAAPCSFRQFNRSTDGGFTWQTPLSIPNSPVWGTLDVATNGNLFIGGASN